MKSKHTRIQPSSTSFKISYTNIRGLRSNFPEVAAHVEEARPDFFSLCETNLGSEVCCDDLHLPGYSPIITKDDRLGRQGHGLAVFIKDGLPCGRVAAYEDPELPFLCFRVALVRSTCFIFCLYRPQDDGVIIFDRISDKIDSILLDHPHAEIHVCGDFNVHHEEWLVHSNKTDLEGRHCHDFAIAYGLTQIVTEPTRVPDVASHFPNLLDLFLTTCPDRCVSSVLSPLGRSDHSVVSVEIDTQLKETSDIPFHRTVFRYSKADWDGFRSFIADAPLSIFFKSGACKVASFLSEWIFDGMNCFIPSKKFQQKPNSQPWFTPECAAAIAHRNHFFHLYHQNRSDDDARAAFNAARNRCRRILRNAEDSHAQTVRTEISNERPGTRGFWKISRKVLNCGKPSIPTLVNGPEVISSSSEKAKLFAANFAANSTLDDHGHPLPDFPQLTDCLLSKFSVTSKEIGKLVRKLDSTKATGPDEIPVVVLKHISPELSPILAKLFNCCLTEKCFPDIWKLSSVCPVFKNAGLRSAPSQYRPISLLSVISKLFEAVMNRRILGHLTKNNLLSDSQYGFRSARSTADALTVITHRVSQALHDNLHARAVALDISKAFDKVWHKGLLLKLASYGISGNVLGVIESFLSDRSLKVVINGQTSEANKINAGVPQGSLLGPTLFLIFINDLPSEIVSSVNMYADDTTVYEQTSKTYKDINLASDLSSDLKKVVKWGKTWLVTFNSSKTKLLSFHHHRGTPSFPSVIMDETTLQEAKCLERHLGLKFTPDLKWNSYILSVAKDVGKMVGSFFRTRKFLTPAAVHYLYKSQIRPKMEYCCHIWAGLPKTSLSCLDRVQRRLRRLIGDELFKSLQPLSHRRNVASLSLLYRYYSGRCSEELKTLVPPLKVFVRDTRLASFTQRNHPHTLEVPVARKEFHANSFFPRTVALWNKLPADCFPANFNMDFFKRKINHHLACSF